LGLLRLVVDVVAHAQDGGGDGEDGRGLSGAVKLSVGNLHGRAALDLSVKANGQASVGGVKELEKVPAATVDPVVHGHVVNDGLR
jgi:hypothetical protein